MSKTDAVALVHEKATNDKGWTVVENDDDNENAIEE